MMADTTIEPTLASLSERLRVLHRQTQETPLFNPVFQLSLDISRKLESGELSIDALAGLVDELEAVASTTSYEDTSIPDGRSLAYYRVRKVLTE